MGNFVHLHLHSEYSLLDGACRISDIPNAVKANGQTAVAITDHGVMYGAVEFYKACKKENIKPIIGCEMYLAPSSRHEHESGYSHITLLVKNEIGYKNLIKLSSLSFTEGFYSKPRIDEELLRQYSEGLVCLSGCMFGKVSQYIINDNIEGATKFALKLKEYFGEDFYLEIQDHGLEIQKKILAGISEISKQTGVEMVATNDVHYLNKSDAEAQAVLMCIQTGSQLGDGSGVAFDTEEMYLKSSEEMEELFKNYENAIGNSVIIAEKCNFDFEFGKKHLPRFKLNEGEKAQNVLKALAQNGLEEKINSRIIKAEEESVLDEYKSRMTYELFMINHMGYDEYFLIVHDFVNYAKTHDIPVGPGRGSGAGSLVAFLIGITEIDPIKYNLLFERFLNPERVTMPDFDIDFCYEKRDRVIKYVTEKYGEDHVSQIVTFGTLAARAAVRDVGKVLGYSYAFVDRIVSLIPRVTGISIKNALTGDLLKLYNSDGDVKRILDMSMAVEGMPRHSSTHAAGVVITENPVDSYMPVSTSSGCVVTQYDMDTVAELGLLKFDFLALRYLTVIDHCEKMIKKKVPSFSRSSIDLCDSETYEMISRGETDGVFQLESAGMKKLLKSFGPKRIEDVMIAISLYRPGPMESIPAFLENRKKAKIEYKIDALEEILRETSGCIIYQEQVMQIFRKIANYSYGKADVIRRIMAKKKHGEIEKERPGFIEGAKRNFIDEKIANDLFDEMESFASYAFNKSHAAAYSVIAYQTAYLKCHYFKEYFASLMSSVIGDLAQAAEYFSECEKNKVKILRPDINYSTDIFTVEDDAIRFPLLAIKGVGINLVNEIMTERGKEKFSSFYDFVDRIHINEMSKKAIDSLIKVGCFDSFGINRNQLLMSYDNIINMKTSKSNNGVEGQMDFFSSNDDCYEYPNLPDIELKHKLAFEKELCMYCFSGHLIDFYSNSIESQKDVRSISWVNQTEDEGKLITYGVVEKVSEKVTKNGAQMAFVTISDKYSSVEIVVFPNVYEVSRKILNEDSAVYVYGKSSIKDDGKVNIIADRIESIPNNGEFVKPEPKQDNEKKDVTAALERDVLFLRVDSEKDNIYLKSINLLEIFEGKTEVCIFNNIEKKYKQTTLKCETNNTLLCELKHLLGEENVVLKKIISKKIK